MLPRPEFNLKKFKFSKSPINTALWIVFVTCSEHNTVARSDVIGSIDCVGRAERGNAPRPTDSLFHNLKSTTRQPCVAPRKVGTPVHGIRAVQSRP